MSQPPDYQSLTNPQKKRSENSLLNDDFNSVGKRRGLPKVIGQAPDQLTGRDSTNDADNCEIKDTRGSDDQSLEFRSRRRSDDSTDPTEFHADARALQYPPNAKYTQTSAAGKYQLRRGHLITFVSLFVFTVILYLRPVELYPSPLTVYIAFIVGSITLAVFIPSQLALEGTLTARPTEVNLILLFCVTALLSIPLAISPSEAWATFTDTFIRCVLIFIVLVNVIRTEARLKALLYLVIGVSIWLSLGALNDYRLGLFTVEGYRVAGRGTGIFGNSNDMALHLVTIAPIAFVLCFGSGSVIKKIVFGACTLLMIAGIVVTYSRGSSIGLIVVTIFLGWKLGRSHRIAVTLWMLILILGLLILAPGNYGTRLLSIFVPSLDPVGSASMRREILIRSVWTAIRHPLFGIGMGNFHIVSVRELVSHNAFTQVAAEMGLPALCLYIMFLVRPFRRLGQLAKETLGEQRDFPFYYLAIGLQASLLGYMVTSFFASVAYLWYVYYLVAYAVCLLRMYEGKTGKAITVESRFAQRKPKRLEPLGSATAT